MGMTTTQLTGTDARIIQRARHALDALEHMTTDDFSKGGDRSARQALALILAEFDAATDEELAEYDWDGVHAHPHQPDEKFLPWYREHFDQYGRSTR